MKKLIIDVLIILASIGSLILGGILWDTNPYTDYYSLIGGLIVLGGIILVSIGLFGIFYGLWNITNRKAESD